MSARRPRAGRSGGGFSTALVAMLALVLATSSACAQDRGRPPASKPAPAKTAVAVFAGGCFWCMEPPFDKLPGVIDTTSGYISGHVANPTYEQVSAGTTGHTEAVRVRYDPARIGYGALLEVFWRNIDPLAVNRQFCDVGSQYRSGIYPVDARQRALAEASRRRLAASGRFDRPIATEIVPATTFYPAEAYHQDYYLKSPVRYRYYRWSCGRDQRLRELWGAT